MTLHYFNSSSGKKEGKLRYYTRFSLFDLREVTKEHKGSLNHARGTFMGSLIKLCGT
jgi:hypothetical protein